jgi:RNA polymerase-associated protein RTF1
VEDCVFFHRTCVIFAYRHGAQERVFRLEFISNQDFTDSEFMKWRETCALQGISMPTHDELEQKLKDIKEAMIYEFKEEDIEKVGITTVCLFHDLLKQNTLGL